MSYRFDTLAIHSAQPDDETTGAIITPIYQTSTYAQLEPGVHKGYCYSRTGNPIRQALEDNLAALEGARYGVAFASGMAAIHCVASLLRSGDHVVSTRDLYGGAWRIFTKYFAKFGVDFTFVDASDTAAIAEAIRPETKLLWLETPSNPLLRITDIAACAAVAKHAGVRVVVDNTFATPVLQRPLDLGADIVVHSTTKYINGHSDVIGGAVLTNDDGLFQELKFFQNAIGAVPGPQDCFLVLRGAKTLALRVNRHCDSAETLAAWLREQDGVKRVIYPAFTDHPNHEIARRQMTRFGAIVSFELDADVEETREFTKRLKLWTLAESLGSVRSLFCHPATMTHASVEPEVRRHVGISDGLIRLSVGLEDVRDLIDDLQQAIAATRAVAVGAHS
ncbi:MAG TPA: PLP-dependent aspartate aminotransferase family protein [Thermoanaerobaculia bacterium]|jgi:cystathionine beta-lyase/cystathionine gamma-synthase|nr:PLP-dependent aspartate aminotransferase family protein [Thermoanaerobaculia bacterium]